MLNFTYPLQYPATSPRTPRPQIRQARFSDKPLRAIITDLALELKRLKARDVIVTSNLIHNGGHFDETAFSQNRISDRGVAIYFTLFGTPKTLACDKWNRVGDNLWAIYRHIEATRGLMRWGVANVEQAFAGYNALPFTTESQGCYEILGISINATENEIQRAFRAKAKACHPDVGGTNAEMSALNAAYGQAMENLRINERGVQ